MLAFVAFIVVHGFGTLKWRFFMRLCGVRLGWLDGFRCYGAGLFANLCLPTVVGGDVLRAGLAMAATRKKTAVVLGSLVDRVADFISLATLAVAGFIAAWGPASQSVASKAGEANWKPVLIAGGLAVIGIAAAALVWRRWRPHGKVRKIFLETLVAFRRLRRQLLPALLGLLLSLSLQFTLLLVQRELGVQMGMPRDLAQWMFIWPTAKVLAMAPISIGGLGVREAVWVWLASLFGIRKELAVSTSLAWQAVLIVGGLMGGAVWVVLTWRPENRTVAAGPRAT